MQNKKTGPHGQWVEWNTDTFNDKVVSRWDYGTTNRWACNMSEATDPYDWAVNLILDMGLRFYK